MTAKELEAKTDKQIADLWNELAIFFEKGSPVPRPDTVVVGFFQLSNETQRRKLELSKDHLGKIILEPKKVKCEKCGDEGWIYGGKGKLRMCNCKPKT